MKTELENLLSAYPQLFVQQRKEWTEIIINWETSNRYVILDASRGQVGFVAERGGGFGTKLRRMFLRSHRPFDIDILSRTGEQLLLLTRKFFWFFSDLEVKSPEGERYGSVHRRFGFIHKIYDLRDEMGRVFVRVESPIWRLWTFPLLNTSAKITKRWSGALREVFTDADTFLVDFGSESWSPSQKAVILAAAISIDFDFFENNQGSSGVLDWLTD